MYETYLLTIKKHDEIHVWANSLNAFIYAREWQDRIFQCDPEGIADFINDALAKSSGIPIDVWRLEIGNDGDTWEILESGKAFTVTP